MLDRCRNTIALLPIPSTEDLYRLIVERLPLCLCCSPRRFATVKARWLQNATRR